MRYWMLFYFIFRRSFLKGEIGTTQCVVSAVLGTVVTILMISSFLIFKRGFSGTSRTT